MPNEAWHPKPLVTSGGDRKCINYRDAQPAGITFCQQFSDPAHNSCALEEVLINRIVVDVVRHTVFGALQNTQEPTKHLSELREIVCFPVYHIWLGFRQKSSALTAVAACNDLHMRVGRDRFPVCDFLNGVSCNVPGRRRLELCNSISGNEPGSEIVLSAQPRLFFSIVYRSSEQRTPGPERSQPPELLGHQPPVTRCLKPS